LLKLSLQTLSSNKPTVLVYKDNKSIVKVVMIERRHLIVQMYNGEDLVREFVSCKEACKFVGCSDSSVSKACRKGSFCKGFKFKYYHGDDLEGEEWRSYRDFMVSNFGRVYKVNKSSKGYGHLDSRGYYCVFSKGKQLSIHRVMMYVFHEERKEPIDHIDRDKTNNHISNLRYTTPYENSQNRNPPKKRKHCESCTCNIK